MKTAPRRRPVPLLVAIGLILSSTLWSASASGATVFPSPYVPVGCVYVVGKGGDRYCVEATPFSWSIGNFYVISTSISGRLAKGAVNYVESDPQPMESNSHLYPGIGVDAADKGMIAADWFRVRATPPGFLMPSVSWGTPSPPPAGTPSGVVETVSLTVTNAQASDVLAGFDQLLEVNFSQYAPFLRSDVGNLMFYTANWIPLDAWLENGTASPSSDGLDIVWVKLSDPIPARSTLTVYMAFANPAESLFGPDSHWGMAPQLSTVYGADDNGARVFPVYDDFKGTTLSSKWVNDGANVRVEDGASVAGSSTVLDWSRDMIKLSVDYGGKDFTADAYVETLSPGRTGTYVVDSGSGTAHLTYDTGVADTVFVDQYPYSFYLDVQAGPASQLVTTTAVTATQGTNITSLLVLVVVALLVIVLLLAAALSALAVYLARGGTVRRRVPTQLV